MRMNTKLQEAYEDALLEQAMHEYMEEEGARLLEESRRLNEDPDFELPEGFDERCQRTINRAFRKKRMAAAGKAAMKMGKVAAIFVAVICVMSTFAFITVEGFRVEVLNLVMEEQADHTDLTFVPESQSTVDSQITIIASWLPEGYEEELCEIFEGGAIAQYANNLDDQIYVYIHGVASGQSIDTESVDYTKDIYINGNKGVCIMKDGMISIYWADEIKGITISVHSYALAEDILLKFSENLVIK